MSTLHVSAIQSSLHWEDVKANLSMFEKKLQRLDEAAELVIFPEMFSTGFSMRAAELGETMNGRTVDWMREMSAKHRIVLVGSVIIEEDGRYYNRLIWMLPSGQCGHYDKRHLFGYGGEDRHYTPGSKRLIASLKGWKINLMICYDLRFPVWSRQQLSSDEDRQPEYDLLVYIANWPAPRIHAWRTLLQARAIENQSYLVGVNRTGQDGHSTDHPGSSMIISPLGEVLADAGHADTIISQLIDRQELDGLRKQLPFLKDADSFQLLAP